MVESALAGIFTEYVLSYEVEGAQDGTDEYGQPTYALEERTLRVTLEQTRNAAIVNQIAGQVGADAKTMHLEGACVNPVALPAEIRTGQEFDLTIAGQAGKFTLIRLPPNPLAILDEVLGEPFIGSWRAV